MCAGTEDGGEIPLPRPRSSSDIRGHILLDAAGSGAVGGDSSLPSVAPVAVRRGLAGGDVTPGVILLALDGVVGAEPLAPLRLPGPELPELGNQCVRQEHIALAATLGDLG